MKTTVLRLLVLPHFDLLKVSSAKLWFSACMRALAWYVPYCSNAQESASLLFFAPACLPLPTLARKNQHSNARFARADGVMAMSAAQQQQSLRAIGGARARDPPLPARSFCRRPTAALISFSLYFTLLFSLSHCTQSYCFPFLSLPQSPNAFSIFFLPNMRLQKTKPTARPDVE